MLQTFTLSNGIRIATYHLPSLRSIHLRISVKGGSLVENKKNNGVAHFMEHMLVQGIPSHPTAEEFSRYVEGLAGSYGAFTERLLVSFYITLPATYADDAVRIGSEVFYEPIFDEAAIEKERIAIIDEMAQKRDSHWHMISKYFLSSRFQKNHPLILDGGGDIKTLKKLTRNDLTNYWQEYFVPENTYVLISGNFSDISLQSSLENYFGARTQRKTISPYPSLSNNDFASDLVTIRSDRKLSTCYVDLTFPSLGLCDDLMLRIKQNLALVILGQLRNSRLFRLLRYQKGLVYDVRAGSSSYPGLGYAYASLEVGKDYLDEALELVIAEAARFIENGPTEEELAFAKNYLTNQWLMTFDHPSSIAGWVESHLLWDEKIFLPDDYARFIKEISVSDIVTMMQTEWDFQKLNLTIQGPVQNSEANKTKYARMLKKLLPIMPTTQQYVPLFN